MKIFHEISGVDMVMRKSVSYNRSISRFHWHENIEIVRAIHKTIKILIDGVLIEANPGDFVFIGEHTVHQFIVDEEKTEILLCQLPLKILLNSGVTVKPVKNHIKAKEISEDTVFSHQIEALLEVLGYEEIVKTGENNPVMQSAFAALYFAFMRKFPKEETDKTVKRERREFYKIVEYINSHFTEHITVQSVAQSMYTSRGKLSAIFLKYSGTNIKSYINVLRVNNANQLLDNGESITTAAFESGFQSMRTFNDIYKNIMSITPSEYLEGKKGM